MNKNIYVKYKSKNIFYTILPYILEQAKISWFLRFFVFFRSIATCLKRKIHSFVVDVSEISSLSSIERSLRRAIWCDLPRRTAQWHGLIYVVVWVHGYFLHGWGPLHAGRLPFITDSTFSSFADIRARIRISHCIIFAASSSDSDLFLFITFWKVSTTSEHLF